MTREDGVDARPSAHDRELHQLARRVIERIAPETAEVELVAVTDTLWSTRVTPSRPGAAAVFFTYVQDEVSGGIGSGSFYANFDNEADRAWLQELLTLVVQGRIEERWSLGCSLRALRTDGTSEVFGQWSPVPWWASRPRRYLPYASS